MVQPSALSSPTLSYISLTCPDRSGISMASGVTLCSRRASTISTLSDHSRQPKLLTKSLSRSQRVESVLSAFEATRYTVSTLAPLFAALDDLRRENERPSETPNTVGPLDELCPPVAAGNRPRVAKRRHSATEDQATRPFEVRAVERRQAALNLTLRDDKIRSLEARVHVLESQLEAVEVERETVDVEREKALEEALRNEVALYESERARKWLVSKVESLSHPPISDYATPPSER
ncbi:hypothetical protein P7C70_g7598, partial [Phenoliferia sp. Uapishka_3]